MTDKELFEKTEKVFKLKKKNKLIENVYNRGKFKNKLIENTSPIRSNVGDSGVSAARAAGRGAAAVGGAIGRGLGALGQYLPGSTRKRMKKAEARKAEAQARQEEIKAQQARVNLMGGKDNNSNLPKMDEALKRVYAEPEFKRVYDKSLSGKDLTANDQRIYDAGMKKVEAYRTGQAEKTGKGEAQKQIELKAGENRLKKLGKSAPNITKFLIDPKNVATKDLYIKYTLQSPALGIPTESETAQLANNLTKTLQANVTEINNFKKSIRNEPNLQDDGAGLIKLLPSAPTKATKTKSTTKKITLKPENVDQFIKRDAKKKNRSETAQKEEMVRQAKKYKVGNVVKGPSGGQFEIADINNETGLITVRSVNDNRRSFKFAYGLGDITEKGAEQDDLPFDSNEESFEQVVKRYR